jgi:outer membrane protein assembly factor BamB
MFQLAGTSAPKVVWEKKGPKSTMINYWANAVYHNGHLYGLSGQFDERMDLRCVDAKDGKLIWSQEGFGKAAITLADGHLFISTKKGDLVLVEATPASYKEKARVELLGKGGRTAPTIADGRLYVRDLEHIYCLDISSSGK